MLTPKQNFMNYMTGEPLEWFPNRQRDLNGSIFISGFDERPPKNQSGLDWYGCHWIFDEDAGTCLPSSDGPFLLDLDNFAQWPDLVKFPDIAELDLAACAHADGVDEWDPDNCNYLMVMQGPFERLHTLMSFEDALLAMMIDPESVGAFFERVIDVKLEMIDALIDYWHADVIDLHDDWGTQIDLFFAPEVWRELLKPQFKRVVDRCHERGVPFELHCCGMIEKIIPELAEIGVDGIQCMGINDIAAMKEATGGKLNFSVSVASQKMAALNAAGDLDEEMVREMTRAEIDRYAPGGHYWAYALNGSEWFVPVIADECERASERILGATWRDAKGR